MDKWGWTIILEIILPIASRTRTEFMNSIVNVFPSCEYDPQINNPTRTQLGFRLLEGHKSDTPLWTRGLEKYNPRECNQVFTNAKVMNLRHNKYLTSEKQPTQKCPSRPLKFFRDFIHTQNILTKENRCFILNRAIEIAILGLIDQNLWVRIKKPTT